MTADGSTTASELRTGPVPACLDFLPDSARLWIFGVSRPLEADEVRRFLSRVDAFLATWAAHGHPLAAGRCWDQERFLMVGVDDQVEAPSGCSIDALLRLLSELEEELGIDVRGNAPVWYRNAQGGIERVTRPAFRQRVSDGLVDGDTRVFDLSLTRVGDVRAGRFEGPARERWHARFLAETP
jgi:hypothetical protein